ncbi:MAG: hypothetical protein LBI56_00430 [Puniceicoccales bacterium]|jgi:hypothetical protein|nr:hypothetical protein [Puniceicoccales bacterium]
MTDKVSLHNSGPTQTIGKSTLTKTERSILSATSEGNAFSSSSSTNLAKESLGERRTTLDPSANNSAQTQSKNIFDGILNKTMPLYKDGYPSDPKTAMDLCSSLFHTLAQSCEENFTPYKVNPDSIGINGKNEFVLEKQDPNNPKIPMQYWPPEYFDVSDGNTFGSMRKPRSEVYSSAFILPFLLFGKDLAKDLGLTKDLKVKSENNAYTDKNVPALKEIAVWGKISLAKKMKRLKEMFTGYNESMPKDQRYSKRQIEKLAWLVAVMMIGDANLRYGFKLVADEFDLIKADLDDGNSEIDSDGEDSEESDDGNSEIDSDGEDSEIDFGEDYFNLSNFDNDNDK